MPGLLAWLFVAYAAVAIPLIAVAMPPFQAADELNHAERAEQIASGILIATRSADRTSAGGMVQDGLARLAAPFDPVRFHPRVRTDAGMRATADAVGWGGTVWAPFPNTAIYPPFLYLPAALGLSLGQAAHLSVAQAMVLSRLLTGLASGAIAALALALAGEAAPLLFALLCLPMSLALFAAISQDGPMIACAALTAVLLRRPTALRHGFPLGCVLLALVVTARPAYLPLCAAPLLAPGRGWRARSCGAAIVLLATVGWVLLTGRLVMPIEASQHIARQMAAIRQHPDILVLLAHTTVNKQVVEGLPVGREFIGVLGWLDTTLPNAYYALTGMMLLVALAVSRSTQRGHVPARAMLALPIVLGAVCAVYAAQYLSWSRIGGAFIDGVQGRYFLPLAPFLLFALPRWRQKPRRLLMAGICAWPLLSIAVTGRAILVRYYLG